MNSIAQYFYSLYRLFVQGWIDLFSLLSYRRVVFSGSDGFKYAYTKDKWVKTDGESKANILDDDVVLLREIKLPILPVSRVKVAVEAEILEASPFYADAVLSGYLARINEDGTFSVEIAIVNKSFVKFANHRFDVFAKGRTGAIPITKADNLLASVVTNVMSGLVVILALLALAFPLAYNRQVVIEHISRFDVLQKRSQAIQKSREDIQDQYLQYQQLLEVSADHPNILLMIDRISAALPDNTFVTLLSIQGRQISIEGQTPNALTLLNVVQGVHDFQGVQLSGSVQRHPLSGRDVFQLQMRFSP